MPLGRKLLKGLGFPELDSNPDTPLFVRTFFHQGDFADAANMFEVLVETLVDFPDELGHFGIPAILRIERAKR